MLIGTNVICENSPYTTDDQGVIILGNKSSNGGRKFTKEGVPILPAATPSSDTGTTTVDNSSGSSSGSSSSSSSSSSSGSSSDSSTPIISGIAEINQTLTAMSGYSDINGDAELGTTYEFYRYDSDGNSNEILVQAASTTKTYVIKSEDIGKVIKVKVVPKNAKGVGAQAVSPATGTIPVTAAATTAAAVAFSNVTANGTSGSVTTTELTFTFDADPTTLTADDITVTGATKGTLTGTTRKLTITGITVNNGENVEVNVASPAGFTITPSSKNVAVNVAPAATPVAFSNVAANGTSGSVTTTELTLTFDVDPTTLTADDITVTGATKGALTGTGITRTLTISDITVNNGGNISLMVEGLTIGTQYKFKVVVVGGSNAGESNIIDLTTSPY